MRRVAYFGFFSCFLLMMLACAGSFSPVEYSPNPTRISNPQAEIKALILANTVQGCISEPEFLGALLSVKAVCSNGASNATLRFDRIDAITLETYDDWFAVRVKHSDKSNDFLWSSKNREDMERLYDSIVAISNPPSEKDVSGQSL